MFCLACRGSRLSHCKGPFPKNDVIIIEKAEKASRRENELDILVIEGNRANADILSRVLQDTNLL